MIACKALAGAEEQDAKAEQQAATMYLHEKILGIVVAGIAFAVIADKIGSTHLLGCFLAGVVAIVILAVVSKIATGIFAGKPTDKGYGLQVLQVGAAMVGRGELGFMQISTAYKIGMVSLGVYGATVWGLLVASISGPFMFRFAVQFAKAQEAKAAPAEPQTETSV